MKVLTLKQNLPTTLFGIKKSKLQQKNSTRGSCGKCTLWTPSAPNYVPTQEVKETDGPNRLFVVVTNVYAKEGLFTDAQHAIIQEAFENEKFDVVYHSPVLKCRRTTGRAPTKAMLSWCQDRLLEELQKVKPKVIICMGKGATSIFNIGGKHNSNKLKTFQVEGIAGQETWGHTPSLLICPAVEEIELDFNARNEYKETLARASRLMVETEEAESIDYHLIESPTEFRNYIAELRALPKTVVASDIETTGLNFRDPKVRLRTVAFSHKEGQGICVPYEQNPEVYGPMINELFGLPNLGFIFFNAFFDIGFLMGTLGTEFSNIAGDVKYMAYILNPDKGAFGYALKPYAQMYTSLGAYDTEVRKKEDEEVEEGNEKENVWETIPLETLAKYNACDCDATLRLFNVFMAVIKKLDMVNVHRIMTDALMPLLSMEYNGVLVDEALWDEWNDYLTALLEKNTEEVVAITGRTDIVWTSPAQLAKYLFDDLKYVVPESMISNKNKNAKTSQRPADENILSAINTPITDAILKYRRAHKYVHTYMKGYFGPNKRDAEGRIHGRFHQTGTKTGRLSSTNPNLQNIPSRVSTKDPSYEDLKDLKIKKLFIPSPGRVMVAIDMSQAEMRYAADVSGDETLIQTFKDRLDMHSATAQVSFNIVVDEEPILKELHSQNLNEDNTPNFKLLVRQRVLAHIKKFMADSRDAAKSVSFGILFNMSAYGLKFDMEKKNREKGLTWTIDECHAMIYNFKKLYSKLATYLTKSVSLAEKRKWVSNKFGRRRYLPNIDNIDGKLRSKAKNASINSPIQGGSSDLLMIGLSNIYKFMDKTKAALLLTVHDSIVAEVDPDYLDEFTLLARYCLEHPLLRGVLVPLRVPLVADVSTGPNYGDQKEIELPGYELYAYDRMVEQGILEAYYKNMGEPVPSRPQ